MKKKKIKKPKYCGGKKRGGCKLISTWESSIWKGKIAA